MAAGAGMYVVAAGAAVVIIGVQCIFHIKCRLFRTKKYFQVKICFTSSGTENDTIKELFQTDRFNRLVIERKGGETVYHATLNTDREYSSQKLSQIMTEHPFIRSIEIRQSPAFPQGFPNMIAINLQDNQQSEQ